MAVAAFFLQANEALAAMETGPCHERCPDDDPGGNCPPTCPTCVCFGHAQVPAVPPGAPVLAAVPPSPVDLAEPAVRQVAAPDPREILHVPK